MCIDIFSYKLGKKAGGGGGDVNLQNNKQVSVTSNGTTTINPDTDYDGMKKVTLTTNVQPNLETKNITISTNTTTTITPTSGKDGLSSVEVITNVPQGITPTGNINITDMNSTDVTNYATAQVVDADLVAENIKKDVNILGVTGTYEGSGGGADLDDYFNRTINQSGGVIDLVKRIPTLTLANGVSSLQHAFQNSTYINLSFEGIDCSNIYTFNGMFASCQKLENIDLNNITNTTNVGNVESLFQEDINLETINNMFPLSGNVRTQLCFYNCQKLKTLDLSNWNITIISNSLIFGNTYKLAVLDISNCLFASVSGNTFSDCGRDCLQSDGAYADGIPYIYVKDANTQTQILNARTDWSTNNVIVKTN